MTVVNVSLPVHLRTLARVNDDVSVDVDGEVTAASVLEHFTAQPGKGEITLLIRGAGKRREMKARRDRDQTPGRRRDADE